tara:strand:- start:317 stop:484 length:168 start_codon:yes stop_codon:yes gene_type:complete
MKVGDLVCKKQWKKRIGVVTGIGVVWRGWIMIYWLDNGRSNQHQKDSLEVINEER